MKWSTIPWLFKMMLHGKAWDVVDSVMNRRVHKYDFETMPDNSSPNPVLYYSYENASPTLLRKVMRQVYVNPQDVVLDVGCGKGGAMLQLAKYPFREVHGVEIDPYLFSVCKKNFAKAKRDNLYVSNLDAVHFGLDMYTHLFLFNPFASEIMKQFLENVRHSLENNPRRLVFIYCNPECEQVVDGNGVFENKHRVSGRTLRDSCAIYFSAA